jgi:RimJ/RimL family protein N-acetyltransferase
MTASPKTDPSHVLETERLALRNWRADDAEAAFAIYGDPRVTALQSRRPYANVAEAHARIAEQRALIEQRGFGHWAMVERAGDMPLVGSCGFRAAPQGEPLEIGFTVAPSRWGRGYGVEIARACARHGIEHLGAPRIVALTRLENVPAQRVLERAGMRPNGETIDEAIVWKVYVLDGATRG